MSSFVLDMCCDVAYYGVEILGDGEYVTFSTQDIEEIMEVLRDEQVHLREEEVIPD